MKVAICFSGETGKKLAAEVRGWLTLVLDRIEPFYAPHDVTKSKRWYDELEHALRSSDAAVLCLTDDSPGPWLFWEAGKAPRSYPVAFGFKPENVLRGPLGYLQMTEFDRGEFERLALSLNEQEGGPHQERTEVTKKVEASWQGLEARVREVLAKRERTFLERIGGSWWERVESKEPTAISYVRLLCDPATNELRLQGDGYGRGGEYTAEWHSIMALVDPANLRVRYAWEGTSESARSGLGEILFSQAASAEIAAGRGSFSDDDGLGKYVKKLFRLYRATEDERAVMDGGDEGKKCALAKEKIRQAT